ncbi:sulfonate ABC transporter ATP-binding protein [Trinickia dabaoshanensis]|uniref:Sulfonate ABC transporter ATP-binding protein n=1 Tax=Trinickia dabaoshanensis TaxID=564714 RepID=A0A2N7VEY7_9BURK|nr:ABC transporter ATP-binding protein [Trinickia dabaoshanensis]PMS15694.1 sulfonate ABC transporter ATP-binding protein [Trinickia dabaoshanensis]
MTHTNKGRIDCRNIGVVFGAGDARTEAVNDVSLTVEPNEFVSLIGPSGCGKSSLLSIVAGFTKPTRGISTLDGVPIKKPGAERGVVFQQYSLFPWLRVRENVEFGLKMAGVSRAKREGNARTLLGLAGLLAFENHYPDQLSGGMKQRIGIVRALAANPQVLLMDEPFGALDTQTRAVMQEILTNMWQRFRLSVLFITHDIEEAVFLSDRIYVMTARPGRIKAEIRVPLPRPRTAAMFESPEFADLVHRLKGLIREESLAAMGSELGSGGTEGFSMEMGPNGVEELL